MLDKAYQKGLFLSYFSSFKETVEHVLEHNDVYFIYLFNMNSYTKYTIKRKKK